MAFKRTCRMGIVAIPCQNPYCIDQPTQCDVICLNLRSNEVHLFNKNEANFKIVELTSLKRRLSNSLASLFELHATVPHISTNNG
jgi:hypothetical protein